MRRSIVIILLIGLLAALLAAAPAEAKKKKKKKRAPARIERVFELPYQCPCGVNPGLGFWLAGGTFGGGPVATGADDLYVKGEVIDQAGQTVYVEMGQDLDGDMQSETAVGSICGSSEDAVPIPEPGGQVSVFVFEGVCDDNSTPSFATSGTVKLTFSNMP